MSPEEFEMDYDDHIKKKKSDYFQARKHLWPEPPDLWPPRTEGKSRKTDGFRKKRKDNCGAASQNKQAASQDKLKPAWT